MNKPISLPVGTICPHGKGMKQSTLWVRVQDHMRLKIALEASLSTPLDRVGFTEFNIKAMYIATTRFDVTGVPTGNEVDVQHETVSCNIKVFTCTSRSIS